MTKKLLLLNGVAILCVILFHATGFGFTAMFAWTHRYRDVAGPSFEDMGTAAYYALRVVEQFVVFSIPAFLFVSGFFVAFLAGADGGPAPYRPILSRIRHLLIPYCLWSGVVLLGLAVEGQIFSGAQYLRLLLTGSNSSYYYVSVLVQLYLIAPLLVYVARRRWKGLLLVTGGIQAAVYAIQYPGLLGADIAPLNLIAATLPKWVFVVHLFWFTLGIVVGFQQQALKSWLAMERTRRILLGGMTVFFVLGLLEWELLLQWSGGDWIENRATVIDGLYSGCLIFAFLAFADVRFPWSGSLFALGAQSYGIYLVHPLVMEWLSRGLYHFAPWVLGRQSLLQPMLITLGLGVPLGLMAVVRRTRGRDFYAHLFG